MKGSGIIKKIKFTSKSIVVIVAILLIIIPITYAIFRSYTNANGSIVAATWNVTLKDSGNNYLSIIPNSDISEASYNISITSQSQVDMVYSIIIEDLPSGVSVSLDNGDYISEINNKVIFSDVGTIAYSDNDKTKLHVISFKASGSASYVDNKEVNINVIARQLLN